MLGISYQVIYRMLVLIGIYCNIVIILNLTLDANMDYIDSLLFPFKSFGINDNIDINIEKNINLNMNINDEKG